MRSSPRRRTTFPVKQPELIRYIRQLTGELPLPLMLYNMPAMTKVSFEPETVRQLLDDPRIVGIKDSSRQMDYFVTIREVTRSRPDWSLLVGFEHMLVDTIHAGGDGGVLARRQISRLACWSTSTKRPSLGQDSRIEEVQRRMAIHRQIYTLDQGTLASIRGIKCGLSLRGICEDRMAEPFSPLDVTQRGLVVSILHELDA